MIKQDINSQMPELLLEMMVDLRGYECNSVREFWVLNNKNHKPGPGFRFAYYQDGHVGLLDKLALLMEHGYIAPIRSEGPLLYRMTEEFAEYLLDGWPERRWPDWSLAQDWSR